MDLPGLGGVEKDLMLSLMPKALADILLKKLKKTLHLGMPNTGIAFTVAVAGCSGHTVRLMETMQPKEEEREVVLILAEKDKKKEIMKAVNQACGMQSEARGIVLSFPVDEMTGL